MPSPISKIDRRLLVAQGLCGYCGKNPIDTGRSKSRCAPCLDYHKAYQKAHTRTHYDLDDPSFHMVYTTEDGKPTQDNKKVTYTCSMRRRVNSFGGHFWEIEENTRIPRADGKQEWAVVKWRF